MSKKKPVNAIESPSQTLDDDKTANTVTTLRPEQVFPNGVHFGILQLPRDLMPAPAAQRIVQWVNRDGVLKAYISENAYQKTELFTILDKLTRMAFANSIARGGAHLMPVRTRIHWHEMTVPFLKGETDALKAENRINPESDTPEAAEPVEVPVIL